MRFDALPGCVPDTRSWGYCDGFTTYVIGFDLRFPERGYTASWRRIGETTAVHLAQSFWSFVEAKRALRDVRRAKAH